MAEIKIEKRKHIWLWILAVLVLVALLIYMLAFRDKGDITSAVTDIENMMTDTGEPGLSEVMEKNSTVTAYIDFIENSDQKMNLDHAYTNEALLKLIAATDAMANEAGYEVVADLDKVKEYANVITNDPFDTTHADNIRKADDILATVLQNIQKAKYPDLADEAEKVKNAATSINPDVLTLDQKDAVKDFFAKASDLLKKMN